MKESCGSCYFWDALGGPDAAKGDCRASLPQWIGGTWDWPTIGRNQWCGHFRAHTEAAREAMAKVAVQGEERPDTAAPAPELRGWAAGIVTLVLNEIGHPFMANRARVELEKEIAQRLQRIVEDVIQRATVEPAKEGYRVVPTPDGTSSAKGVPPILDDFDVEGGIAKCCE